MGCYFVTMGIISYEKREQQQPFTLGVFDEGAEALPSLSFKAMNVWLQPYWLGPREYDISWVMAQEKWISRALTS